MQIDYFDNDAVEIPRGDQRLASLINRRVIQGRFKVSLRLNQNFADGLKVDQHGQPLFIQVK